MSFPSYWSLRVGKQGDWITAGGILGLLVAGGVSLRRGRRDTPWWRSKSGNCAAHECDHFHACPRRRRKYGGHIRQRAASGARRRFVTQCDRSLKVEDAMPQYEYRCQRCENEFTVNLSMTDHETQDRKHKIRCPKCQSTEVKHLIESVFVTTSKKS